MTKIQNSISNLNVIANCLEMNSSRAIRKREGAKKIEIPVPQISRINIPNRSSSGIRKENNKIKNKEESSKEELFIIFQKSNAKKLKKEIDKYSKDINKNSVQINENFEEGLSRNESLNFKDKTFNHNINNTNLFQSFNYQHIISTEESVTSKQKILCDKEDDELKNWLVKLGVKGAVSIDFSKDKIREFKDGKLLANIVSILEKTKISGINPNTNSHAVSIKNITRSLEILRNKKVI